MSPFVVVAVVFSRVFGTPANVKTPDEALTDAKYKKVHSFHLRGKRGQGVLRVRGGR